MKERGKLGLEEQVQTQMLGRVLGQVQRWVEAKAQAQRQLVEAVIEVAEEFEMAERAEKVVDVEMKKPNQVVETVGGETRQRPRDAPTSL